MAAGTEVLQCAVLLPSVLDGGSDAVAIPAAPPEGLWGIRAYREARASLASLDTSPSDIPPVDRAQVDAIVTAIYGHAPTRTAMAAARASTLLVNGGGDATHPGDAADAASDALREIASEGPRYLTLQDLDGTPPPPGVPLLNTEIGVLSVATPETVAAPASAVSTRGRGRSAASAGGASLQAAVRDAVPAARVEPPQLYRAFSAFGDPAFPENDFGAEFAESAAQSGLTGDVGERYWREAWLSEAEAEQLPWGVTHVRANAVWETGAQGTGVRVAVVDTGVGPHVDLPYPVAGINFVPNTNSWHDDQGHGTHVAGTIAGLRNGRGVVGVAPRADLLAVKVLASDGLGDYNWIASGITWAVNNLADVINLSLGGGFSETIRRALVFARLRGAVVCAAAGNDYGGPVGYPARDPLCIAVGSIDRNNRRGAHSNVGSELDLTAPGVDVLSTVRGNRYEGGWNGTSMATPHVSGVVALLLSRQRMDPTRVQTRLMGNALPRTPVTEYGAGIVQADRAVLTPRPGT